LVGFFNCRSNWYWNVVSGWSDEFFGYRSLTLLGLMFCIVYFFFAKMDDANGFVVDVSQVDTLPHENRDLMSIRINVDDYDEALEFFKAHGFTTPMGETTIDTGSSKGILQLSPSGFLINLVKHIKG